MQTQVVQKKAEQAEPKRITWEEFERRYLSREDKFKYEWVNGLVEKTERTMNQYQFFIWTNLHRFFEDLRRAGKISGDISTEVDTFFLPKVHRRPDIVWFSDEQLVRMAKGENQVPEFVIEVVSNRDNVKKLTLKMRNYRDAGVKVVWQIHPDTEEVIVSHGKNSVTYTIDETCSAAPVLPAFAMKVSDIFKKPA